MKKGDTLKSIAAAIDVKADQWRQLLEAWVKLELGPEFKHVQFARERNGDTALTADSRQILNLINNLDESTRKQVIMAITRPEVLRTLPSINNLHDTLKRKADHPPARSHA